jgi:hypothetical protein
MTLRLRHAVAVAVLVGLANAGCGGKDEGAGGSADAGGSVNDGGGGGDVASPTSEAGLDSGLPPGTVTPTGKQLVASATVSVQGVTSDGYVIYLDSGTNTLSAIALAGGSPISVGPVDSATPYVLTSGTVVYYFTQNYAALTIWTAAHGTQPLSTSTSPVIAISSDDTLVAFVDGVDMSTGEANLLVASTDGTAKHTLVSAIQTQGPTQASSECFPQIVFNGSVLVASYCPFATNPDAGFAEATVASFSAPSWTAAPIATAVFDGFAASSSGSDVLVSSYSGLLDYPAAGGSTVIDPDGELGIVTSDGKGVVYPSFGSTPDGGSGQTAVKRASFGSSPTPTLLAAGSFDGLLELSTDDAWALAFKGYDMTTYNTDLFLLSATTPGTAQTVVSTQSAPYGSAVFTTDSSWLVFLTEASTGLTYSLSAMPTGGAGAVKTLSASSYGAFPTSGAKILFDDNVTPGQVQGTAAADIDAIDLSGAATAKLLVTQADAVFFLTADKTQVAYSWSYAPGPLAGVWVMSVP